MADKGEPKGIKSGVTVRVVTPKGRAIASHSYEVAGVDDAGRPFALTLWPVEWRRLVNATLMEEQG